MRLNRPILLALLAAMAAASSSRLGAGDILRGGSSGSTTSASPVAAGGPAGASLSTPTDVDILARTTQALASVQAMQAAARALATAGANNLGADPNHPGTTLPNVPNGLAIGGLQVATGTNAFWSGAAAPTQTVAGAQTTVTVTQTTQQALLNWQTFNVGKQTTLNFDQSAGGANATEWIAFNRILDPTGVPSQILGSIQAAGQVYVLNQNGIIFGGSSQVNAHALVASSLPINDNLIASGLLNNPDEQFLFSSVAIPAGANGTPAFTPAASSLANGAIGDVTVQAGAQLTSPASADSVGGRIMLVAPNVTNAGSISTPDGQTILAAGQQVGLAAHDSSDPSLRGLDVFVGLGTGAATNAAGALIYAPEGDITMAASAINQLGALSSTTSVSYNGRIDLLASYNAVSSGGFSGLPAFFPQATGAITLGANSVTEILPELSSTDRVVGAQLALNSQVNLQGSTIYLAPAASLLAPSAAVSLQAGTWNLSGAGATATDAFAYTTGQIYVDRGAAIDVAGSSAVSASVAENIVAVQLLGSELANSPLQRNSALRGQTVQIDVRATGMYNGQTFVGTPLADVSGYVALVDHTVGELTTNGGTVNLTAGSSVVLQSGSSVNVSGGWINYAGGMVETTKLLSDGHVFDISQATPDRVYDGIYTGSTTTTDSKWGTATTSTDAQLAATYQAGYVQGGNGGSLNISAPAMALDGSLLGTTVAGARQRTILPTVSSLALAFVGQDPALPQNLFPFYSPTPANLVFQSTNAQTAVAAFAAGGMALSADRKTNVFLSPILFGSEGFGALKVTDGDGSVTVPATVALDLPVEGSLTLAAAKIDVEGQIVAPDGSLAFTVYGRSPYADRALTAGAVPTNVAADPTRGSFTLGSSAVLETSGLFADDRPTSATAGLPPLVTAGGNVSITAYSAQLNAGSVVDASGGLSLSGTGAVSYGKGGNIAILAGQDPAIASVLGGKLTLGAQLESYSGITGGSLTLLAPQVQIGGQTTNASTLLLAPAFFDQGGFSAYTIEGLGSATGTAGQFLPAVVVAAGTTIDPVSQSLLWDAASNSTGLTLKPAGLRSPVSLTLAALGVRDPFNSAQPLAVRGDLVVSAGSKLVTDPGAAVKLTGDTVSVQGSVSAPGGTITVSGGKDSTLLFASTTQALPTVDLGPTSVLSTAGTAVLNLNAQGLLTGTVLPGGTVTVSGNVVAEGGALIDVSGTQATVNLAPSYSLSAALNTSATGMLTVPTQVSSAGGSITLAGAQELFTDATLRGSAGGANVAGGSLTVSSGRFYPVGTSAALETPADTTLTVLGTGTTLAAGHATGSAVLGQAVVDSTGTAVAGQGYFSAASLNGGGFDALALNGTVQFSGTVALAAATRINVGSAGVVKANGAVTLTAPEVDVGTSFLTPLLSQEVGPAFLVQGQPYYLPPVTGTGALTINAHLIDVGNLSLQSIGALNLNADNGDVRGDGTLDIAGILAIRAGQVYPPTETSFTLAAYDYTANGATQPGTITVTGSGQRSLPLSGGGDLSLYATQITQNGTLRAPLGTINLGWDGVGTGPANLLSNKPVGATQQLTLGAGSVTSVSAIDPITGAAEEIPYGVILNGTSWIDPAGNDITLTGPPAKNIAISAVKVNEQSGATIDLRGGGDLYAYRFVSGTGGTVDVLASSGSFAVIPSYGLDYAPYAPYNPTTLNDNLGGDAGYVNSNLKIGDKIYLAGGSGLAAGYYTLLPARYALLPGALLVTPQTGVPPAASVALPDGSSLASGYRFNGLSTVRTGAPIASTFEIQPGAVVRAEAEYDDSSGNTFLAQSATAAGQALPRLPVDAGQLALVATNTMALQGAITAQAPTGGLGGLIDISSPVDIVIAGAGVTVPTGSLGLSVSELDSFGAESLLIGGLRSTTSAGTVVAVNTANVTINTAGTALTGSDLIVVANKNLTVTAGSVITGTGTAGASGALIIGNSTTAGSGDGTLLRVESGPSSPVTRLNVDSSATPLLTVAAGAKLNGASITLDSTHGAQLDSTAVLSGTALALDAGQIDLQLTNAGTLPVDGALVLTSSQLQALGSAQTLSLLSYSSINLYGTGAIGAVDANGLPLLGTLALHAGSINGFNTVTGAVTIAAQTILLDNQSGAAATKGSAGTGSLTLTAATIQLGTQATQINQFGAVALNASGEVIATKSGSLITTGSLTLNSPLITGAAGAVEAVTAGGTLTLARPNTSTSPVLTSGLGASLSLTGSSISDNGTVVLPSGLLNLHATTGALTVGTSAAAVLDVSGVAKLFNDLTEASSGGMLTLTADAGGVTIGSGGTLSVTHPTAGGSGGTLAIVTPTGMLSLGGTVTGADSSLILNVGQIGGAGIDALNLALNAGGFNASRNLRVETGNVTINGLVQTRSFTLSADQGSITVGSTGTIDASGATGGNIELAAAGAVTLQSGSKLTVAAADFDAAGKGGSVDLETRGANGTQVSIQTGSTIDLSVATNTAASAALGDFTGTLHVRAPQNAAGTDLLVAPIQGTIVNASSVMLEGYAVFDLSSAAGATITPTVEAAVLSNGTTFGNSTAAILARVDGSGVAAGALQVEPGAEIVNSLGDLTLNNAWDLSADRFGPNGSEAGVLTLKAAGNLNFTYATGGFSIGSLSDGFGGTSTYGMWDAPLLAPGSLSWSYRLVAGADFGAADYHQVQAQSKLASGSGSVQIGLNTPALPVPANPASSSSTTSQRSQVIPNYYEVIRTGTGSIDIAAGRDVLLLNPIAAIYTAGTQAASLAGFAAPNLTTAIRNTQLGPVQTPIYPAQYSLGGGNVTITAQDNIAHELVTGSPAVTIADSSKEMPENWLYREGSSSAPTSWWIDYSNFFEGVGALGGGNVVLSAGNNITDVDAVVPTNARSSSVTGAAVLQELGGGNLSVKAGANLDGGVYYVERGQGVLQAGGSIVTNSTRAAVTEATAVSLAIANQTPDSTTWLPTTLFLGKGSFTVSAGDNVLLGPVANPFLLPQGANNNALYKSYFSTYASTDAVNVSALTGAVTVRDNADGSAGSLATWFQNVLQYDPAHSATYASYSQPWLRVDETNITPFFTVTELMPGTLKATAFTGDIDLIGTVLLSPSPTGTLDLVAAGSINGLQVNGYDSNLKDEVWASSLVNLSDADPSRIPSALNPLGLSATQATTPTVTSIDLLASVNALFNESGSTTGQFAVIQTKQALHAPGPLHASDANPVHLYAATGDISGLTLFAGKASRVVAGRDLTDLSLYIQNDSTSDLTVVAAGRDLIAYDPNSALRVIAQASGNELLAGNSTLPGPASGNPDAGDIQISGPGTLEVLARRNLDLGVGVGAGDGTGVGIVSIGNARNPYLPFGGADIVAAAGVGATSGLNSNAFDFADFESEFLNPATAGAAAARYLPDLAGLMGLSNASPNSTWAAFSQLNVDRRDELALQIFYLVLRDSGRDHSVPTAAGFGNYKAGFAAISALFPKPATSGNISLTSREIKTASGGNIELLAPAGGLTVGFNVAGSQAVDQGLLTEDGGNISIFTKNSVVVGTSRIFTLRGGNEIIWSSTGDIAAGASSKTVQSAPPTRVLIDPQSGDVKTDLAGLATGGGIGVLETVVGVPPGDVDLIAPVGAIDAGDAGIRVSGNLNISAVTVLNSSNVQVGGTSVGTPATVATSLAGALSAASSVSAAGNAAADTVTRQAKPQDQAPEPDSLITVEVLGYGGS